MSTDPIPYDREEVAKTVALLRGTLEATTDGLLLTDRLGQVTDFNHRFARLWNLPPSFSKERQDGQILTLISRQMEAPEAFIERVGAIYESVDESNDLLRCADGRLLECHSQVQWLDGELAGRIWSFREVTDQLQSEIVARRLAAIVDSSDDAIIGKDLNLIITSWNSGAERIFGYTAEEMIGSSILRIVPPDHHAEEESIRSSIIRGERVLPMETVRVGKNGQRLNISVTISPIKDSTGRVIGASQSGARHYRTRTESGRPQDQ